MARQSILISLAICLLSSVGAWVPIPTAVHRTHNKQHSTRRIPFLTLVLRASLDSESDSMEEDEPKRFLINAGNYWKGIDEDVGNAMCRVGEVWSSDSLMDWSQVAEALEEVSTAFWDVIAKKNISPKLKNISRSVAQELEDISTIEGCSSVGPVASVPNWINIHGYLDAAAKDYEGDEDHQRIYDILKKTSLEIEGLIESI